MPERVGVIGAGAWGTALALQAARNQHEVLLWAWEAETVEAINRLHENPTFLPGIALPESLKATSRIEEVLRVCSLLIWVTPSQVVSSLGAQVAAEVGQEHRVIVATKGLEAETQRLISEVLQEVWGSRPRIGVLSGPTFAQELALQLPTAAVIASEAEDLTLQAQSVLHSTRFRLYRSHDVIGVQLGGVVKNVLAIAAGIVDGMQLGLNARAALVCRGLAEMLRLGLALGGQAETFSGLSGLGDLVLTSTGALSRNHELGYQLGTGKTLEQCLPAGGKVAEGAVNAHALVALARQSGVEMPICSMVHRILQQELSCAAALESLLERDVPHRESFTIENDS